MKNFMGKEDERPEKPPQGLTGPVVEHAQSSDPRDEYKGTTVDQSG